MCFRRLLFSKVDRTFQTPSILLLPSWIPDLPTFRTADRLANHAESPGVRLPFISARLCVSRLENTYSKLFLELGVVVGAQILDMLQECLLVDRPDRRQEEHLEGERKSPSDVTICYFLRAYFSPNIC